MRGLDRRWPAGVPAVSAATTDARSTEAVALTRETGNEMADTHEAYCVKCREKREMQEPEEVTMKNGRQAVQGKCGVCGTKLFRILGGKKKES